MNMRNLRQGMIGACLLMAGCLLAAATTAMGQAPPDFDADRDVDLDDMDLFRGVFSGPAIPASPGGMVADFDGDGDVDLVDGSFVQAWLTGPDIPAPPLPAASPDSAVQWTLSGPSQVGPGSPLPWKASVRVTGDNQGLGLYAFSLELRDSQGQLVDAGFGATSFTGTTFSIGGQIGSVLDPPAAGGPGMDFPQSPTTFGDPFSATPPGILNGVGAAYLSWRGSNHMLPGIGRDEHKSLLLNDLNGDGDTADELYILDEGWLDTSSLVAGETYTLTLAPDAATVLAGGLDLANFQESFAQLAGSMSGSSFTFVVPEPGSLFLLAGCIALLSRTLSRRMA